MIEYKKSFLFRSLTFWLTCLCVALFFGGIYNWTLVYGWLLFDVQSFFSFGAIRQGQVWRLLSPCFLHQSLWHLLFNLGWLWILGLQIESRLSKIRMVLLIALIGMGSNVVQYLVEGPFFEGISGVVMGFVGFIWVRQKKYPQEGYPLPEAAIKATCLFVLLGVSIEGICVLLRALFSFDISFPIANTAHVVGGGMGCLLGLFPFFTTRSQQELHLYKKKKMII